MAFLRPNDEPTLLKRKSDNDIGGDLRQREKHLEGRDEMRMLRDIYPNYDPTTAQKLNETQSVINGWFALAETLKETEDIWVAQDIVNELLNSINNAGYNISKMLKERKIFDMNIRINRMVDSNRLFNFDLLLDKFEQLRNTIEKMATRLLRSDFDMGDIMIKLEEARSVIPDAAPSQGLPTRFDSRAMDVLAHKYDRTSPNYELEKHPPQLDAINSKPQRGKAKVERLASSLLAMLARKDPENDKDPVAIWKFVAISLLTMQSGELILDDNSEADIWNLAARCMSEIQPGHGSERVLPGIDFITVQNEVKGSGGISVAPLQQMERLLSGIPDARARGHVLFKKWTEEENGAFACEFSRLVRGSWDMKTVLQKWHELLE
ncbi:hypothetical protein VE04_08255 [Pseudogymnoascus sp. 24MN13]|nr:hypothetical protein VE04_08255 [Pseudogymnoascus sp. 24MN13]